MSLMSFLKEIVGFANSDNQVTGESLYKHKHPSKNLQHNPQNGFDHLVACSVNISANISPFKILKLVSVTYF